MLRRERRREAQREALREEAKGKGTHSATKHILQQRENAFCIRERTRSRLRDVEREKREAREKRNAKRLSEATFSFYFYFFYSFFLNPNFIFL
jgi:hypothetical protein